MVSQLLKYSQNFVSAEGLAPVSAACLQRDLAGTRWHEAESRETVWVAPTMRGRGRAWFCDR
jgi:hypothetical protein